MASGWAGSRCLPTPSDQGQQGAAGQGLGQQGAASLSVVQARGKPGAAVLDQGCQGAAGWPRDGQGRGASPSPQRSGAARCCRAGSGAARCCASFCGAGTGAARGCFPGSGVSGTGPGSGTRWFCSPPGAAQPPPLPPWAGRAGAGARQCDTGGQGSAWGGPSGAPRATQECGSPSAAPQGGGS